MVGLNTFLVCSEVEAASLGHPEDLPPAERVLVLHVLGAGRVMRQILGGVVDPTHLFEETKQRTTIKQKQIDRDQTDRSELRTHVLLAEADVLQP